MGDATVTNHVLDMDGVALKPSPALPHWRWTRRVPAASGDGAILSVEVSLTPDHAHYSYRLLRQSLQLVQGEPVSFNDALEAIRRSGVNIAEGVWRPGDGLRKPRRPSKSPTDTAPGEVYFAQSVGGGPIKIGFTAKGARRRVMRQSRGGDLRLLAVMPGTLADEYALHRRFASFLVRRGSEWFYAGGGTVRFHQTDARGAGRMKSASERILDSVESAIERAREAKDYDRVVRLELKRDRVQAKAFRALQKKIRSMPK